MTLFSGIEETFAFLVQSFNSLPYGSITGGLKMNAIVVCLFSVFDSHLQSPIHFRLTNSLLQSKCETAFQPCHASHPHTCFRCVSVRDSKHKPSTACFTVAFTGSQFSYICVGIRMTHHPVCSAQCCVAAHLLPICCYPIMSVCFSCVR